MLEFDRKIIEALKGIGILGVILVHYGTTVENSMIQGIVNNGARGAQLMFVINGFLIFNSLSKIELNRKNIIRWWKGKFIRLIPLYYFFAVLHLLCFGIGERYYLGPLPQVSFLNIICNFSFLHGLYPYYANSINVNWFMGVLAIFYILAPYIYKMIKTLQQTIIAVLLSTGVIFWLNNILSQCNILEAKGVWYDYVNVISFTAELPVILLGVMVYFVLKKCEENTVKLEKSTSIFLLVFSFFCMFSWVSGEGYFVLFNNLFSFGVLWALVLASQLICPVSIIRNLFFTTMGKHSYGINLSHIVVMKYVKMYTNEHQGSQSIQIFGFGLVIILSYIVSISAEKVIEKKGIKMLKCMFEK